MASAAQMSGSLQPGQQNCGPLCCGGIEVTATATGQVAIKCVFVSLIDIPGSLCAGSVSFTSSVDARDPRFAFT